MSQIIVIAIPVDDERLPQVRATAHILFDGLVSHSEAEPFELQLHDLSSGDYVDMAIYPRREEAALEYFENEDLPTEFRLAVIDCEFIHVQYNSRARFRVAMAHLLPLLPNAWVDDGYGRVHRVNDYLSLLASGE